MEKMGGKIRDFFAYPIVFTTSEREKKHFSPEQKAGAIVALVALTVLTGGLYLAASGIARLSREYHENHRPKQGGNAPSSEEKVKNIGRQLEPKKEPHSVENEIKLNLTPKDNPSVSDLKVFVNNLKNMSSEKTSCIEEMCLKTPNIKHSPINLLIDHINDSEEVPSGEFHAQYLNCSLLLWRELQKSETERNTTMIQQEVTALLRLSFELYETTGFEDIGVENGIKDELVIQQGDLHNDPQKLSNLLRKFDEFMIKKLDQALTKAETTHVPQEPTRVETEEPTLEKQKPIVVTQPVSVPKTQKEPVDQKQIIDQVTPKDSRSRSDVLNSVSNLKKMTIEGLCSQTPNRNINEPALAELNKSLSSNIYDNWSKMPTIGKAYGSYFTQSEELWRKIQQWKENQYSSTTNPFKAESLKETILSTARNLMISADFFNTDPNLRKIFENIEKADDYTGSQDIEKLCDLLRQFDAAIVSKLDERLQWLFEEDGQH